MGIQKIILFSLIFLPYKAIAENKTPIDADIQQIYIGEGIAEAKTEYGDIRGYQIRNIYAFLGVPYGDNTSGENRFMPPKQPKPWDGLDPKLLMELHHHKKSMIDDPNRILCLLIIGTMMK